MNKGHFKSGEKHHKWNGGKYVIKKAVMIKALNHPRSGVRGYINEATLIVEKILGKHLPPQACVHHIDGNPHNNHPSNLVVCENNSYHKHLHIREKALKESGDSNNRRCKRCKKWDSMNNMRFYKSDEMWVHPKCAAVHSNKTYHKRMGHL